MRIIPKTIPQETVLVRSPEGEWWELNELECLDLRIQICKERQPGWTGKWNEQPISFDEFGDVIDWPDGLFSEDFRLLRSLREEQENSK